VIKRYQSEWIATTEKAVVPMLNDKWLPYIELMAVFVPSTAFPQLGDRFSLSYQLWLPSLMPCLVDGGLPTLS